MRWSIALLAISSILYAEEEIGLSTAPGQVLDQRENYFPLSTPYKLAATVHPITGDLMEEEEDLVVAGIEPLSVRRFYNHTATYEPRTGGWRYNPETYLIANLEWIGQEKFAALGEAAGGITFLTPSSSPCVYTFDASTGFTSFQPTGKTHPLHTTMHYTRESAPQDPQLFAWKGESLDGRGCRRYFCSPTHRWLTIFITDVRRRGHTLEISRITPNVWTPYHLPIYEQRQPHGNIICYSYKQWKETTLYPRPSLLHTITAYNADKTKILGTLTFRYDQDKKGEVRGITAVGSDGREVKLQHRGSSPLLLQRVEAPGKPPVLYSYHKQAINRVERPNGNIVTTQYNKQGKVAAQYAPVGPQGEMCPIGTYTYTPHMTQCVDAEGHTTEYHIDEKKRLHTINLLHHNQVYRSEHVEWDTSGNCTRTTLTDGQHNILSITSYHYDQNHNPIEETVGNGTEWHTTKRTFSTDGFNLKLSESSREGLVTTYSYKPNTNLLERELVYARGTICKRTFYSYDDCAICIKIILDDGSTTDPADLSHVTYRKIIETTPLYRLPCFGLPAEVVEKTIDAQGKEILLHNIAYVYAPSGQVLQETHFDAAGVDRYTIQNTYDQEERLLSTTSPLGYRTSFAYDANHNLISIQGPRGDQQKDITYDKANRPIRIADRQQDGSTLYIEKRYDRLGQVTKEIDASGHETSYTYDRLGRVTAIHYPEGSIERKEYDVGGHVVKEIDGEGYETRTLYDYRGNPLHIYYPTGEEEQFTYHSTGTLASHIDKKGAKHLYHYDLFDRPTQVDTYSSTGLLLHSHSSTYSTFCKLSETTGEGVTTLYSYDYCGRKTAEQTATQKRAYVYDTLGRVVLTDYTAYHSREQYDLANQLLRTEIVDPEGTTQWYEEYAYDEAGNRTRLVTAEGSYSTSYTTCDKPLVTTDPLGFSTHYVYAFHGGYRETAVDAKGIETHHLYDARNREVEVHKKNRRGETISSATSSYNKNGDLIQNIHTIYDGTQPLSSLTWQWEYGPLKRIERLVEGGEKETLYLYTPQGRLTTKVKPSGHRIDYEWDDLGRLSRSHSSDFDYHYTYDRSDRLLSVYDATTCKTTSRLYNALGCLLQEDLAHGLEIRNTYDDQGRRTSLLLPDQTSISYSYRGAYLYRVTRQGAHHIYSARDLSGHILESQLPYQLGTTTIHRDTRGRWESFTSPYICLSSIQYDPVGNLLSCLYHEGAEQSDYRYDELDQLITENEHTYQVDSLGNRLQKDGLPHQTNPLCQTIHDGEHTYRYDLDGNCTCDGYWRYTYDTQDRLIALDHDSQHIEYEYDSFHRRLSKKSYEGGRLQQHIYYLWDGEVEIGALSPTGALEELRVLGEGLGADIGAALWYEIRGQIYVPLHDYRGCVVALVDPLQHLIESYRYTAFGEEGTTGALSPWRFSSKRVDEETGLVFFGRRYYNPRLGRWMTQDPQGYTNTPNLYSYLSHSPLTRLDLYGLRECLFDADHYFDADLLGFPPLPYSTLMRAGRLSRHFPNFDERFAQKTSIYDLSAYGRPSPPRGMLIAFCNGICNTLQEATANALYLSDLCNGYNIVGVHRASHGIGFDLMECAMQYQGTITSTSNNLHIVWNTYFAEHPQGLVFQVCTSGGALCVKQSLETFDQDLRKNILVAAIAPADYISRDLCHSVQHYSASLLRDVIPYISWKERWKNRHTVHVLPSHPEAPLHDHPITSKTYAESLIRQFNRYLSLVGERCMQK